MFSVLLLLAPFLIIACTTTPTPDGPSVQGRSELKLLKCRDEDWYPLEQMNVEPMGSPFRANLYGARVW
jgi:hypothetical protein